MTSHIQYYNPLEVSYSVLENKNAKLAETINLIIYALPPEEPDLKDLDLNPVINEETPYIQFRFNRIILEQDSSETLLDVAESYSAQLYNIIKPMVDPESKDFIQDIFNIQNTFEITHFIYLEKAIISSNFPENSLFAALSKGFSVLFKGASPSQVAGGFFKKDTFFNDKNIELDDYDINQIILHLNMFELSSFISQLPRKNNTSCIFSANFFNKNIMFIDNTQNYDSSSTIPE